MFVAEFLAPVALYVVVFLVLVAVHESGHLIAALALGARAQVFSVGFGPALWSRTLASGLRVRLALIPLGGYVLLAEHTGRDGDLNALAPWRRAVVLIGGPAANVVLAFALYLLAAVGGRSVIEPVIDAVLLESPAARAGVGAGDRIERVGRAPMRDWEAAAVAFTAHLSRAVPGALELEIRAPDGVLRTVRLPAPGGEAFSAHPLSAPYRAYGMLPRVSGADPLIASIITGSPAEAAGLLAGDRVLSVDDDAVLTWSDLSTAIILSEGAPLNFLVRGADGVERTVRALPRWYEPGVRWFLGVRQDPAQRARWRRELPRASLSAGEALGDASARTWSSLAVVTRALGHMVTGTFSLDRLSGPVDIARTSQRVARQGLLRLIELMAFLSVAMGVTNLLPLPLLDGGRLVGLALEVVLRRPIPFALRRATAASGLVLLGLVMLLTVLNDLSR